MFRASLRCSEKGVVHSVVPDLQFLGNFSHGMAFISQNKNRLMRFRRNLFVSGHFEPEIEPKNADAPDTSTSLKKPSLIDALINTTVFSCANIIQIDFSNYQLAF